MNVVVEGIYDRGIIKLKTEVQAPNYTEVMVIFKNRPDKMRFLKSAGSWKNIDTSIFSDILKSREDLRERNVEL
jgi:predicted DNA-binding antitoxin AbrB/MazE fold protein